MDDNAEVSTARRNILLGGGAVLGMAATGGVFAGSGHDHHHHHKNMGDDPLIKATLECISTSQACLAHCIDEFKRGETEMADCAQAVQEAAAMCGAMLQMTYLGSQHLKKVAAGCLSVCESCEKACDEFADKHDTCKVCRDSCQTLIKQLKHV